MWSLSLVSLAASERKKVTLGRSEGGLARSLLWSHSQGEISRSSLPKEVVWGLKRQAQAKPLMCYAEQKQNINMVRCSDVGRLILQTQSSRRQKSPPKTCSSFNRGPKQFGGSLAPPQFNENDKFSRIRQIVFSRNRLILTISTTHFRLNRCTKIDEILLFLKLFSENIDETL